MDSKHKNFLVFTACFGAYFIVNECFLALPKLYDVVQIRPVSALGPVLGFFFGLPGIFGCASANLLSDVFHESASGFVLLAYFWCKLPTVAFPAGCGMQFIATAKSLTLALILLAKLRFTCCLRLPTAFA